MGFRFPKSINILPGLRVNLSKSGVSASVGVPGASVNLSERGARGTVGLPGTGLSYSKKLSEGPHALSAPPACPSRAWIVWPLVIVAFLVGLWITQ